MTFKRSAVFQWLIAALALVPVILYAYLGQFSRLMFDDYCIIGMARVIGPWEYMIYRLDTWGGGYANWLLKGLMAPLDILVARIMPVMNKLEAVFCAANFSAVLNLGMLSPTIAAGFDWSSFYQKKRA